MNNLDDCRRRKNDRRKRQKSNHNKKRTDTESIHDQRAGSLATISTESPTASSIPSDSPAVEEHRKRLAQYLRSRNYPRKHGIPSPTSTSYSSQPQYSRISQPSVSRSPILINENSSQKVSSTLTSVDDTTNSSIQLSSRKRKRTPTGESPTGHKITKIQPDQCSSNTATAQRQNDHDLHTESAPYSTQNQANEENQEHSSEETASDSHAEDDMPTSGVFQDAEMKIVYETVESFRTQHQLSQTALNSLIQESSRKKGTGIKRQLWDDLYKALPTRLKSSIANFVRRKYHNYEKRGVWTTEEDEQLRQAYAMKPNQWVDIGKELGRMGGDCRDRWRNYLSCEDIKTQRWTEVEEMELSIAVEECKEAIRHKYQRQAVEERKEFEEKDWESMVNFSTVSEKLGQTRNRLQCYQHWKAMSKRAQSPADSTTKLDMGNWRHVKALDKIKKMKVEDKLSLLRQIHDSLASEERWIPWRKINLTSSWTILEKRLAFETLKESITSGDTLQETVDALTDHFEKARLEMEQDRMRERSDETQGSDDDTRKRKVSGKPGSNLSTERVAESDMSDDDHESTNETHSSPDSTDSEAEHILEPTGSKSDDDSDRSNFSENTHSETSTADEVSENGLSDREADKTLTNPESIESEYSTDSESSNHDDRVATSAEDQQKDLASDSEEMTCERQSENREAGSSDSDVDSEDDASTAVAEDYGQDKNAQPADITARTDKQHGNNDEDVTDSEDESVSDVIMTDADTSRAPSMTAADEASTIASSSADPSVSGSDSDSEILDDDDSKSGPERASSTLEMNDEEKNFHERDESESDDEITDVDTKSESALSDSSETSDESGGTATNKETTGIRNDIVAIELTATKSTEEASHESEDVSSDTSSEEDDNRIDEDDEENDDQVSKASRRSSSNAPMKDELKASNSQAHNNILDGNGDSEQASDESSSDDAAVAASNTERLLNVSEDFATIPESHNDQDKAYSAGDDSGKSTTDEEAEDPKDQSMVSPGSDASNVASLLQPDTTLSQDSGEDANDVGAVSSDNDNDEEEEEKEEEAEEAEEEEEEEREGKGAKLKADSNVGTPARIRARSLSDCGSSSSEVITLTGPSTINRFTANSDDDESTSDSSSSSDNDSDDDTSSQDSTPWPWDKK